MIYSIRQEGMIMDPDTALQEMLLCDSMNGPFAQALRGWLARGGFAPRIEVHPACDAWMLGDRFGAVVGVGRKYLSVKMDRSGRVLKFSLRNVYSVL